MSAILKESSDHETDKRLLVLETQWKDAMPHLASKADIAELKGEIKEIRADNRNLATKIDNVETRLDAKIDNAEARLDARIDNAEARLEAKIETQSNKTIIAISGVVIAIMGAIEVIGRVWPK